MHPVIANRRRRIPALSAAACTLSLCMASCGTEPKQEATVATAAPALPLSDAAPLSMPDHNADAMASIADDAIRSISIVGKTPVGVPGSDLSAHISGSFHKSRAPLVGVSVLVSQGEQKAEVSWRIESGQIESDWRPIEGRRYDDESETYVEEQIPGWLVRLDSVEDHSAGGDPTAITISLKRAP